jgi:hypothetical protein
VKYPERLARRGDGSRPFHSAFATTFSIEFAAVEELMLPKLMESGATNLLVVADERMASMSLSDGSRLPIHLGRDYELFSPPVSDGLFHPKIVLQIGRKAGRLFVGSANISAAGLAGNAEAVVELECRDEPTPEREIVRAAWHFLSGFVSRNASGAVDACRWAVERAPWLIGAETATGVQELDDGTVIGFLPRQNDGGIGSCFIDLVGGEPVERLVVASPYWDGQLAALSALIDGLQPKTAIVLLDEDGHEFPAGVAPPVVVEFRAFPQQFKGRFKHAKFVIVSTASHDHVLVGSANCTTAALGRGTAAGENSEACIYRRLPRGRAIEALNLSDCLLAAAIDPDALARKAPTPPIPMADIATRKAGAFEIDGDTLTWTIPGGFIGSGSITLLDTQGTLLAALPFQLSGELALRRSFRLTLEKPEQVSFARVHRHDWASNRAHVSHRSILRRRRREVATGSVARAVAVFEHGGDFELWMHGAFDELARADFSDRPLPPKSPPSSRDRKRDEDENEARPLSYEEFMETRSPDVRKERHLDSTLAGTHSDSIRSFLNLLVGKKPPPPDGDPPDRDDKNDRSDDDDDPGSPGTEAEAQQQGINAREKVTVDPKQCGRMIYDYATIIAKDTDPLGPSDVLRVRYWLMLLLYKARHPDLPRGLDATSEEHGWPRMALRVISAFFCGTRPPVTRVMIAREYTGMPVDFLECWATVLWTLDTMESLLDGAPRHRGFVGFVRKAKAEVVKVLGLTPNEMNSETMLMMRSALDYTFGDRLGLISGPGRSRRARAYQ